MEEKQTWGRGGKKQGRGKAASRRGVKEVDGKWGSKGTRGVGKGGGERKKVPISFAFVTKDQQARGATKAISKKLLKEHVFYPLLNPKYTNDDKHSRNVLERPEYFVYI